MQHARIFLPIRTTTDLFINWIESQIIDGINTQIRIPDGHLELNRNLEQKNGPGSKKIIQITTNLFSKDHDWDKPIPLITFTLETLRPAEIKVIAVLENDDIEDANVFFQHLLNMIVITYPEAQSKPEGKALAVQPDIGDKQTGHQEDVDLQKKTKKQKTPKMEALKRVALARWFFEKPKYQTITQACKGAHTTTVSYNKYHDNPEVIKRLDQYRTSPNMADRDHISIREHSNLSTK
jgi:hypothetical protein